MTQNTEREFQDMLNEYLPNKLLREDLIKRDYLIKNTMRDDNWKGGEIIVPFKGAGASSVRMGQLTPSNDIAQDNYVRGKITKYQEAWGSMIFNHADIMQHGKVSEQNLLKILPDTIEDFIEYFKMVASVQWGTGPSFAKATGDGTATGVIEVSNIDRFMLGQKVILKGTTGTPAELGQVPAIVRYVAAIDVNLSTVRLADKRSYNLATAGDFPSLATYVEARNPLFYTDGAHENYFTSARSALLSEANGGSATLHGQSKLLYPYLQAVNIDGSSWSSSNILDKLFDAYTEIRQKGKGTAREIICSYKIGGEIMKKIENRATANANHSVSVKDKMASLYGWDEILLTTVKGTLKIVMIQEWDDDLVWFRDPRTHTFRSNGFFKKRMNPHGHEYYELRQESGYKYILDICLFGEMEWTRPGQNGIVHSISI